MKCVVIVVTPNMCHNYHPDITTFAMTPFQDFIDNELERGKCAIHDEAIGLQNAAKVVMTSLFLRSTLLLLPLPMTCT